MRRAGGVSFGKLTLLDDVTTPGYTSKTIYHAESNLIV